MPRDCPRHGGWQSSSETERGARWAPRGEHERDWCYCMSEVLKLEDISKELQVSVRRARELIGSGKIPMIQGLSPRMIRVSREDLNAFTGDSSGK